jgi:RimJ/RimL family protein N-acetyltransferase
MSDVVPGLTITLPRLTTQRLLLREYRTADFDAYAENMAEPEATRFLSGPVDRRTSWRMFAAASGGWVLNGAGWWALEVRETGAVVGEVGAFVREGCPDFEIGWNLYRRFWGQGFAIEGARAALDFAFEGHRARRVIAHIAAANRASIAVSQKLGMTYETDVDFFGAPIGRYALER